MACKCRQIERQPMTRGVLKLHFDRLSASRDQVQSSQNVDSATGKKVTSQGVWKTKGRRGDQEDSFGESIVRTFLLYPAFAILSSLT